MNYLSLPNERFCDPNYHCPKPLWHHVYFELGVNLAARSEKDRLE